jgi:hypothetical protein
MKRLYIRFFDDKDSQLPVDSDKVFPDNYLVHDESIHIGSWSSKIGHWMATYPNGKVDFVWL